MENQPKVPEPTSLPLHELDEQDVEPTPDEQSAEQAEQPVSPVEVHEAEVAIGSTRTWGDLSSLSVRPRDDRYAL